MSTAKSLSFNFTMNLDKLAGELRAYQDESKVWECLPGISNSAGNLTAHLLGNLNHFIGHGIGNTGYVRLRDLEFSVHGKPVSELVDEIKTCKEMIVNVLGTLSNEQLAADYSMEFNDRVHPVETIMLYMLGHLTYHLGQINYLRRIQENK